MKKDGSEESVKLVRPFRMQKRYHSADVMQTFHLRAKRCLLMKVTVDEIAILLRGDPTHPMNPDATRMTDYLANHVFRHLILVTADGKIGVAPLIRIFTIKNFLINSHRLFTLCKRPISLGDILLLSMINAIDKDENTNLKR